MILNNYLKRVKDHFFKYETYQNLNKINKKDLIKLVRWRDAQGFLK